MIKKKLNKSKKNINYRDDAGKGLENVGKPVVIKIKDQIKKIDTYKKLENFVELYFEGVEPSDVALALLEYVKKKNRWLVFKILKDGQKHGSIFEFLEWIDKKGGAVAAYNNRYLKRFCLLTGYKKPASLSTFQNDITTMKEYFGISRKKTGEYTKKQLQKAELRVLRKKLKHQGR